MIRLFRQTYKGADGTKRKCRVWCVRWSFRGRAYEKSLGTRDKQVAQQIAADLIRKSQLRACGLLDPFEEHRDRPIEDHVRDFEATLRGRGVCDQYVHDRMRQLREFLGATSVRTIAGIDLAAASRWVTTLREPPRSLSANAVNAFIRAVLQFTIWLVKTRRAPWNPLEGLRCLNPEEDRRRVRRALTPEE